MKATDKHQRYQTSYTTLCNGTVSHGVQFGGLRVFAKINVKQMLTIFTRCAAFCACLHTQIALHAGNSADKPWLFWLWETQRLQIQPHAEIKMA